MELLSEDPYKEQRAKCEKQVKEMTMQELLNFFAANYVDESWHRFSQDISMMGRGFPDAQVRFSLVRARLEREFPQELKQEKTKIQTSPEYQSWRTTVQKHGW